MFRLALRHTEGLIGIVLQLLGLDPPGARLFDTEPPSRDAGGAAAGTGIGRRTITPAGG
jgi:hypothetical protein